MAEPSSTVTNPLDHLPLSLLRSETIPPVPTRSASAVDWLPDFAGYSWLAYGASTLFVISHFPSPLSAATESLVGPFLRQVFELSGNPSSPVSAVSWSPVMPSVGEVAAASENCISVFAHDSAAAKGSFCWSQNAVLVQSAKVEAIKWTGSGDGIVSGGIDVVLWRRRNMSWEIAWKFRQDEPQTLVSATWSIEGPSATAAAYASKVDGKWSKDAGKCVLVCYSDEMTKYAKAELQHPQPVSMIQWRLVTGTQSHRDTEHLHRHILLTCCLDGTVRLWMEVDKGKARKGIRKYFCVAAVVEINQTLNGTLGTDVFLTWATETGGIYKSREGSNQCFFTEGQNKVGQCEWLIGFGPGTLITFWAVHCLDDVSPMRFPRITLWKKQELQDLEVAHLHGVSYSNFKDWILLNKVVILRSFSSGPPNMCSFIHLLPCGSFVWSLLDAQTSSNVEGTLCRNLLCTAGGMVNVGHTGKILRVALHPQVELAVSMDSNGLLLAWSASTISNSKLGLSKLFPSWKFHGKLVIHDSYSKYTSLRWAPSVADEDHVLLMGHAGGIDCFIVKISQIGKDKMCHYFCTIPTTGDCAYEDGPTDIFAIPLPSACEKTFHPNKFLLLGVWMPGFHAISWEVTLHSYDLLRSCECNFDDKSNPVRCKWNFEKTLSNKRYCIGVNPFSSRLPEPHSHDQITSFSVLCPGTLIPVQESVGFQDDLCSAVPAYIMATGCSDGSLKLWRSNSSIQSSPHIPWELVGAFVAHRGPITAIYLTGCGRKIATVSARSQLDGISVHIWDTVHLIGAGSFILEDRLSIDGDIVSISWLTLCNGQLLLGVCMQNELRIYTQRCSGCQILPNPGQSVNTHQWSCVAVAHAFSAIHDFFWGPQATAVIVHERYFSVLSQWLSLVDNKQQAEHPNFIKDHFQGGRGKDIPFIFADCDIGIGDVKELTVNNCSKIYKASTSMKVKSDCLSSSLFAASSQLKHGVSSIHCVWSLLEIAEKSKGTLPIYHPVALLMNIYSGYWKRAYVCVRHLVESLMTSLASEKRYRSAKHNHPVPHIPFSNYFQGFLLKDSVDKGFQWSADVILPTSSSRFFLGNSQPVASNNEFNSSSTKSELMDFVEPLEKNYNLAGLTSIEKFQILAIVDLLNEIQHSASAYTNLDEPGRRFWVALRFHQLHFFRSVGRPPSMEELVVGSKLMSWAFHSDCQETLLNSFLPNDLSWKDMRALGLGFWFTNVAQLRTRMEKLARLQYLRNKDPKDCALLYIALNRIQVLAGLFKISKDEKDKPLVGFLSRNFQEEKNKAAALKNAYVLMGRHQLELAIAFFLLGGDNYSAITVCAKNLGDEQLALVICRLIEGRGGLLEHHLITKFILPSARDRGDFWLESMLEWEMGNYFQSFLSMLGFNSSLVIDKSALSSNHVAFTDPHIGVHCISLAIKNGMRNAVGEQNAAILGRWATFMAVTAFTRCGLPLEALECLSSCLTIPGGMDQGGVSEDHSQILRGILKKSSIDSFNWLSADVALCLEWHAKLDLALQCFSKLMREHPRWTDPIVISVQPCTSFTDCEVLESEKLVGNFQEKLFAGLQIFEQKFSVASSSIIKMIFVWLRHNGLWYIGCDILRGYACGNVAQDKSYSIADVTLHSLLPKSLLQAYQDACVVLSRFICACSITCFQPKLHVVDDVVLLEVMSNWSDAQEYYFRGLMSIVQSLRAAMRTFSGSFSEDDTRFLLILDLFEYYIHFACAWLQRNSKCLFLMVQPLLVSFTEGQTPYEVDMLNLKKILFHTAELMGCNVSMGDAGSGQKVIECAPNEQDSETVYSLTKDEKWHIIGACLWHHMSMFLKNRLSLLSIKLEDSCFSGVSCSKISSWACSSTHVESDSFTESFSLTLAKFLNTTIVHISSHHIKQLMLFLHQKVENRLHVQTLLWLAESSQSQAKALYQEINADILNNKDELSAFNMLWETCADPSIISKVFAQEKFNWSQFRYHKSSKDWNKEYKCITREHETEEASNSESSPGSSLNDGVGSTLKGVFGNGRTMLSSWQKDATITKELSHFESPKEICKRDGELLEALCINSMNEQQAALSSNRKGIIFFSWGDGLPFRDQSHYIWSDADWPPNGWAGAESTPVPTCVSPGVGLGSKKGAHLGLGGATIGVGSLARPRKDLTGGAAFGIPGYAGIGASGLGWEVQDDFEEFADPPATMENVSSRAFSSHPSRPFFLVGSSNTHIYLWEFGKEKATATYGVLPAANVPPPYALASISALQFDQCGHRFATAALDGTVCTWQLEVGGRSNIRPTESSLCFNGHASDITYVTSSGSIIAAAGYSSNGVNVVIWDTLAPPTTSQASINCHEGGARSICVFDNDIGSGSISPLIVTGGKSGDVGLHDFRFIATGRMKRHRHFENGNPSSNASSNTDIHAAFGDKVGDQNPNGMLWYIPKAHSGSVTKISTIPHTSLFLTGSKDGHVKLWDAKAAKLVHHWPKLHERRTFLQPNSRGFRGIVRAGVTDIQVVSHGFLSCGGDGSIKLVQLKDYDHGT